MLINRILQETGCEMGSIVAVCEHDSELSILLKMEESVGYHSYYKIVNKECAKFRYL
jgi:hypothetical protein